MKRKKIIVLTTFILLFNAIFVPISFGANNGTDWFDQFSQNAGEIIGEGLVWLFTLVPKYIALIVTMSIRGILGYIANIGSTVSHTDVTAFDFIANNVALTDVNFFRTYSNANNVLISIKENIASWYNVLRGVAAGALLCTLLYLAIKTITTQSSSDKAAYKHMLTTWLTSMVLLFVLHYVMVLIISLSEVLTSMFVSNNNNIGATFSNLVNDLWTAALYPSYNGIASAIAFCLIIYISAVFAVLYINRMVKVGFLILISPIVVVSYSLDKQSGKSPSLDKWFKEFTYTVSIQPFHALLFSVFAEMAIKIYNGGAGNLLQGNCLASSILLYFILTFIWKAEKLIRQIFFAGGGIDPQESISLVKKSYAFYGSLLKKGRGLVKGKVKKKTPSPTPTPGGSTGGGGTPSPSGGGPGGSGSPGGGGGPTGGTTSTTASSSSGSPASSSTGTASSSSPVRSKLSSAAQNVLNNKVVKTVGKGAKAVLKTAGKVIDANIEPGIDIATTGKIDGIFNSGLNLTAEAANVISENRKLHEQQRQLEQQQREVEQQRRQVEEALHKMNNSIADGLKAIQSAISSKDEGNTKYEITESEVEKIVRKLQNGIDVDEILKDIRLEHKDESDEFARIDNIFAKEVVTDFTTGKLNDEYNSLRTNLRTLSDEIKSGSLAGRDASGIASDIYKNMHEDKNNN